MNEYRPHHPIHRRTYMGKGKEIVNWEEELAAAAVEASSSEAAGGGGAFLSFQGGRISYGGSEVPNNKLNVVVLDAVMENQFYVDRYDPDHPSSPVCYAFGRNEKDMAPHPEAPEPQAENCATCPMNQWGSADTGKGKACKNVRRIAVITEDALDGDLNDAEVVYAKVPVMSVKNWSGYVNQLAATIKRPPFVVVTELSTVPDPKSQFRVQFKMVEQLDTDPDLVSELMAKHKEVKALIDFPYQAVEVEEKEPAKPSKVRRGRR